MMKPSFLQTTSWQRFQEAIGHPTWRLESPAIQATVIRHDIGWKQNYLSIPYGPTIVVDKMRGVRNEMSQFVQTLTKLGREQKSLFVRIEPRNDAVAEFLFSAGAKLRKSSYPSQPTQSVVLDLVPSSSFLLEKVHPKTRQNINLGQFKGLTFEESDDVSLFWKLSQKTSGHSSPSKQYYQKLLEIDGELEAKLFVTKFQHKPIGAIIVLIHGDTAYYLHGAMDPEYRNLMAPYFTHWQAIRYLKDRGCVAYDFWGIDAKKYPAATRFKLAWGGKQVEYPGAFDLVLRPIWYDACRLLGIVR